MTKEEAQRMLGDAIVLERAVGIIDRVYAQELATHITLYTVRSWLKFQARAWREEAESHE
jgi:hypothetical protein